MATRFRLPNTGTAERSPAVQTYTHTATTRTPLVRADRSTLTTNLLAPDNDTDLVAGDILFQQFVSPGMVAGIQFTNAAAITYAVQALEANNANNLNVQFFASIVSEDGTTVQRTLRTKVESATELVTTLRNNTLATTQDGATYTTVAGDRLVVEFSLQGTPAASGGTQGHNGSMRFGGSGTGDLPADDTDTSTTLNPWVEFAPAITFVNDILQSGQESTALPLVKKSIGVAALTIGLSLLSSTLAPAAEEPSDQFVTQSTTLIQAKRPAPSWDPPNLLTTTLAPVAAAEKPFAQLDWPTPASRRLQWLVTTETRIGADDAVVAGDLVKPLEWPLPQAKAASVDLRTWTQSRPSYYTEPVQALTMSARPKDWPNPQLKPVSVDRWTWLQSRPSYYTEPATESQPVTQSSTWLQGQRPAPAWTPPNLLQNTLTPAVVGDPPIRQHTWPLPPIAKPRPVATLQFIGYYVFSIATDPFVSIEWSLPAQRKPAPLTWTQNLLETTLGGPPPPLTVSARPKDWPNPFAKPASLALRTWTQSRPSFYTEPVGVDPPIRQHHWPIPPQKASLLTSVETRPPSDDAVFVQPPFAQTDWPNPPSKPASLALRTWTQLRPPFFTEPRPFSQTDWPNPKPLKPAPKDWTQRPAVPGATPEIRQYDWPNPRVKPAAFDLRTLLQSRPSFYTEPKPFAQLDWPTPKPFKPAPHVWTQSPDVPLGIPLRPLDWPLPRIKAESIDLKTWIQKRPAYYVDSTSDLVVTIHTVGLDAFQTLGAGLDIRPGAGAGLDVYATGSAGLDISANAAAGVSDRAAPAGLDAQQSVPAGLGDAT